MIAALCIFAFLAGFVDAIAGGGGLIQLPALLIFLPGVPVVTLLGTNKLVSCTGTGMAVFQYARRVPINWRVILISALAAFPASFLGARAVSLMDPNLLRPVIIVLLAGVALYMFFRKNSSNDELVEPRVPTRWQPWAGAGVGAVIGFYDGFFGPGTGSFLIFAFVSLLGLNFLMAGASAKVVNLATNLAALLYFAVTGQIQYLTALPMIAFNILGAVVGSRLAMWKGSKFVRSVFLFVVLGVIIKLVYDLAVK
jgi:uncharacterized protein